MEVLLMKWKEYVAYRYDFGIGSDNATMHCDNKHKVIRLEVQPNKKEHWKSKDLI